LSGPFSLQPRDGPMYEEFYGFVQPPFTLAPDPRFLYLSDSHDEAIRLLLTSIRRKEGFIVLAGDIGTGKTTLCRALLEQLDTSTFTSLVLDPFVSVEELLKEVLLDFGVISKDGLKTARIANATAHELVSTLHDFLLSIAPIGGVAVLVIDEAQHLTNAVLEQIRVLSNLETSEAKLLQIVLVGQLDLLERLTAHELRQLNQRISLRTTLKPLTRNAMEAYIGHRLGVARASSSVTFDAKALDVIHAQSAGVPRVINLLCDRALMLGAAAGKGVITADLVRGAAAALGQEPATAVASSGRPRWQIALAALLVLIVVAIVVVLFFVPADRLVDAPMPSGRPVPLDVRVPPTINVPPAPEGFVPLYPAPAP
jgi:general secretion pathway protein A